MNDNNTDRASTFFLPLVIALTFLTRLPVAKVFPQHYFSAVWNNQQISQSGLWYPFVGFVLAVVISMALFLLPNMPAFLQAVIIVSLWVALTGALHIDGLADSVDAACAAHGSDTSDQQQTKILTVFNDPAAGPMAVVSVVLLLLLKVAALAHMSYDVFWILLIAMSAARGMALLLLVTTPYVRSNGLGASFSSLPVLSAVLSVSAVGLVCAYLLPFSHTVIVIVCLAALFCLWRRFWISSIGGVVGDCVGALIELSEVTVLVVLCLLNL